MDWLDPEDRSLRLNLVVNNTRFLIFPWVCVKNLASKSLSLAAKRIRSDWRSDTVTARYYWKLSLIQRNTGAPVTRQQTGSTWEDRWARPDGPSYKKVAHPQGYLCLSLGSRFPLPTKGGDGS
ncbi:MAG: DUF4338 domain-containing protein [Syntrophaceticus schinkii]